MRNNAKSKFNNNAKVCEIMRNNANKYTNNK